MEEKNVKLNYNAVDKKWSASENPVKVYKGLTKITWTITLDELSNGVLVFGTDPDFAGITFNDDWPGSEPKGDKKLWTTNIADTMSAHEPPKLFHYTVNAWYSDPRAELEPQQLSWDPEVEEENDPPPPVTPPTD